MKPLLRKRSFQLFELYTQFTLFDSIDITTPFTGGISLFSVYFSRYQPEEDKNMSPLCKV